jgi:hypothetical protein
MFNLHLEIWPQMKNMFMEASEKVILAIKGQRTWLKCFLFYEKYDLHVVHWFLFTANDKMIQ